MSKKTIKELFTSLKIELPQADDFDNFLKAVGYGLLTQRTTHQLSLETVAQQVNIAADVLAQIEAGQFNWPVEMIMFLRKYYTSVSVSENKKISLAMSEQTHPGSGEEAAKLSHKPHFSLPALNMLDTLFEGAYANELREDLTEMLLLYIMHECDNLPDDFSDTLKNYLLLLDWLEVVENETKKAEVLD